MDVTPTVAQLCFRLAVLSADLQKQVKSLNKRVGFDESLCECIVEPKEKKKKEKQGHLKKKQMEFNEIIESAIEFELLD